MRSNGGLRLAYHGFAGIALVFTLFGGPVFAQAGASTGLTGHVTDSTGGAIPGVTVTLRHVDTGRDRVVTTRADGGWEARFLSPGTYRITFQIDGFRTLRREGVEVSTAEMSNFDVSLEVGGLTETVAVVGNAEMVSSRSMTVVKTLDQKELDALPTSARNFTQLLVIEPGVSADISELLSNDNASISPSVNGARTTNNSFVFNGIDVTNLLCCNSRVNGSSGTIENGGGSLSRNIAPAPETLQEVKLQTSLYDAATGRNGGGNFTLVSKSGTNSFDGTVYYYHQNDKLIANDFFFNRAGIEKPLLRRHEGGVTVGGPIVRNKTFFFGSYQRTQAETSFVDEASNTVLPPRALTDDRSRRRHQPVRRGDLGTAARPRERQRHQPDLAGAAQGAVSRRHVPDPVGRSRAQLRPSRDQLFESCQVVSVIPATFEQDQFTTNLDHQLTQSNRLSGKFFFSNQPSRDPLANGNALTRHEREETTRQRTFSLTDVHIFSPTVVNEFRAGFFRNRNDNDAGRVPHQRGVRDRRIRLAAQVPDLTQITHRRRRCGRRAPVRHAGRRHAHLRPADDVHDRQYAVVHQGEPLDPGRRRTAPAPSRRRPAGGPQPAAQFRQLVRLPDGRLSQPGGRQPRAPDLGLRPQLRRDRARLPDDGL